MFESGMDESVTKIEVDVTMEIFLKGRVDPLQPMMTFVFNREHLIIGDELDSFMGIIATTLRNVWDSESEPLFIFSDRMYNKFFIPKREVQSISVLSPIDSLAKALELE